MGNQMESSIFVLDPIKGVFWPFKVDRRIYLTDTVLGSSCLIFIHVLQDLVFNVDKIYQAYFQGIKEN